VPEALAAVAAELGAADAGSQLLLVEFWQRAVRDPQVREAFARSRRTLRSRIADAAAAFLTAHPPREGPAWDPQELAVVLVALANGLALEALPDPGAVPDGLVGRVLARLVL
jgi:hypothetical protein